MDWERRNHGTTSPWNTPPDTSHEPTDPHGLQLQSLHSAAKVQSLCSSGEGGWKAKRIGKLGDGNGWNTPWHWFRSKFWLWSSTLPGFDKPHWVQGRRASWQTTSWIIIKCKASDGEEYSCWLAFIVCPHYACLNCQAKIPCYSCSWMPHVAGPSAFTGGFIG